MQESEPDFFWGIRLQRMIVHRFVDVRADGDTDVQARSIPRRCGEVLVGKLEDALMANGTSGASNIQAIHMEKLMPHVYFPDAFMAVSKLGFENGGI